MCVHSLLCLLRHVLARAGGLQADTLLAHTLLIEGRLDRCKACGVDLHCCRLCALYERSAYQQCREPTVEEVRDKQRANFCDYFKPASGLKAARDTSTTDAARAALEQLFGKP
jgi:hypothetical protein